MKSIKVQLLLKFTFIFTVLSLSCHKQGLAQFPSEVPSSNKVHSVSHAKNEIRKRLNPPSFCDTKGCIAPLSIQICAIVGNLNTRVNGKIIGKPLRSKRPLKITSRELALMKKIWSQCKTVKAETVFIGVPGEVTIYSPSCELRNQILKELDLQERMYQCNY
ncbi:hypothetical protein FJR11_22920 [Anabaena sp. UHCC 0187]|uniref:hypothetical protein n=1 Tax=Anabaena sp. UHCC 0187 TaxID=2590018 RepID=UPI0014486D48|nr:hypothetical protein [Anabaena sp. UHCC 0187]MTJ15362.1 hypothetical protein [Anabaena sp. UHCC 0187]